MLKKFNWGWGIAAAYTSFALLVLFMAYKSTQNKVELVTPDYYAQELKYQERINQIENSRKLQTPLAWEVNGKQVVLSFPSEAGENATAKVLFYKANNSTKDVTISAAADADGKCVLASEKLEAGVYQMQIEWQANNTAYYTETTIKLQ